MRHFLFCILILLSVHSSAQFTGAIWAGARVSGESEIPIPYQDEVAQYRDTLVANAIDTTNMAALNYLIWSLKGNNPSYPYNYWDSIVSLFPIHEASPVSQSIDLKNVAGRRIEWGGTTAPDNVWRGARGTGAGYGILPVRPDSILSETGSFGVLISGYSITVTVADFPTFGTRVRWGGSGAPVDAFYLRLRVTAGGIQEIGWSDCIQSVDPITSSPTVNFNGYFEYSDSVRTAFSTGVYSSYKCDFYQAIPAIEPSILAYRNSVNSGGAYNFASYSNTNAYCTGVIIYKGRLDVQKSLWLTDMFKVYNEKMLR